MGYGIRFRVFGDYALFTRPEMKAERVSYDVMTPSAARGIIEAIYWKPAIRWVIDKIHVINEIKYTTIRRNEVGKKLLFSKVKSNMLTGRSIEEAATEMRQQRSSLLLKDVEYVIEAHFELTEKAGERDSVEKHYNIILRRLRKGQCFNMPYLGTREFSANFENIEEDEPLPKSYLNGELQLGYMFYDLDFCLKENKDKRDSDYLLDVKPAFFKATLYDGVLDLTNVEVVR